MRGPATVLGRRVDMFNFFGRKTRLMNKYPPPTSRTIVEPFAGSAAYAVHHRRCTKRVVLIDRDETVCDLWRRLLSMTRDEILDVGIPEVGSLCSDFLVATSAARTTKDTPSTFKVTSRMREEFLRSLPRIASVVDECRHFEVLTGDYTEAPDIEADWFIDPPYQYQSGRWDRTAGGRYLHGSRELDYRRLASWCEERRGQTIVCEQRGATWLPWTHESQACNSAQRCYREVWYLRSIRGGPKVHGVSG
mgnify:CR=1 FL=1